MPSTSKQRDATRKRLQNAYKVLIKEKAHEAITATEIAKCANLSRNTFYMYFRDRDDIFISFHKKLIDTLAGTTFRKEELFNPEPSKKMVNCFEFAATNRQAYEMLVLHNQAHLIQQQLVWTIAYNLALSLKDIPDKDYSMNAYLLRKYIAAGQVNLVVEAGNLPRWYAENHVQARSLELATISHKIRRAALLDAIPADKISNS